MSVARVAGCEWPDCEIGVYVPDPEAYTLFAPLLDGVIKSCHALPEKKQIHHPAIDFGDLEKVKLDDLDPDGKYIISTRVRVTRSLEGYGFHPVLSKEVRTMMREGRSTDADRQTNRRTDRRAERQTDRRTDKLTGRNRRTQTVTQVHGNAPGGTQREPGGVCVWLGGCGCVVGWMGVCVCVCYEVSECVFC